MIRAAVIGPLIGSFEKGAIARSAMGDLRAAGAPALPQNQNRIPATHMRSLRASPESSTNSAVRPNFRDHS